MTKIRWGIVGTGGIAHRFANAIKNVSDCELIAVASRTKEGADSFADEFNIANRFSSYEELANADIIDAVYIGVPHGYHADTTILFLNKKISVLGEKPMSVNSKEAQRRIDTAKENNTFPMEAMWARFTHATKTKIEHIDKQVSGEDRGGR